MGGGSSPRSSAAARAGALGALGLALVVVAILILGGGSSYSLSADFQNASGLVTGDNVLIGPAAVGTISSISLTRNGEARVNMSLHGGVGPMHQGTVARIVEDSLSGIASRYVELEPGPSQAPPIDDGGVITDTHTYAEVNIDQLFDTFDPLTRAGLSGFIRGEAASLKGRGRQANQALKYLAPGLQTTSQLTAELTRDQPTFDQLVVQGADALSALASRSDQLSQLIANTSTATGRHREPEPGAPAGPRPATGHPAPGDDHLLGPADDAQLAGPARGRVQARGAAPAAVPGLAAQGDRGRDPHDRGAG